MKMHTVEHILEKKNYRKCPLKKRPVNYQFDDEITKREIMATTTHIELDQHEPENLSLKKTVHMDMETCSDDFIISATTSIVDQETAINEQIINVSDCCEDEGVEIDHNTDYDENEEDEEMIDCVDIEDNNSQHQTQAAALAAEAAALAAVAAANAAAVVVPTPTYPKYGLPQSWNFHMSPYTAEFYRTISNPHLAQQISPLRSDLLSPSSPSDSLGSLSPPPSHYMHGRASSVSPPMHTDIIHRPMSVRQLQPQTATTAATHTSLHQHATHFMPYPLSAFHHHHPASAAAVAAAYPLAAYPSHHHTHHHAPISPAYSESSYYSIRSMTPESTCSSALPEDLSLKQHKTSAKPAALSTKVSLETSPLTAALQTPALSSLPRESGSGKKEKNGPPRYQCPDCQKSYSTFSGLTKHQQFHCPAAEGNQIKKSFSCKDCDKTYVSLGALKMHIRTHTLPCKCNICGKAFSRPWLLQGHIRTHTGEKPFSCQHCHRAFADRSNLRAHLQTHSDIKKYSCSRCSKTFSRMSLLTKHSEGGCPGGSNTLSNNVMSAADNFVSFTEQ